VSPESQERRQYPRINLSQVVRIRPFDPNLAPEYCTTLNVSRNGLYFATQAAHYTPGMSVYVMSDFQPNSPLNDSVEGAVIRIDELEADKWGVAIRVFSPSLATAD
jgi:PilZ domain